MDQLVFCDKIGFGGGERDVPVGGGEGERDGAHRGHRGALRGGGHDWEQHSVRTGVVHTREGRRP